MRAPRLEVFHRGTGRDGEALALVDVVEIRVPRRHYLRRTALVDDHAGLAPERLLELPAELDFVVPGGHVVAAGRRERRCVDVAGGQQGQT